MQLLSIVRNIVTDTVACLYRLFQKVTKKVSCSCGQHIAAEPFNSVDADDFANPEEQERYVRSMQKTIKTNLTVETCTACKGL
uniref:Secreted protein n=1 Tax=Steinernema glaseri TaxID=37863 RepID=A0A1I8AIK4_9BILA